MAEVDEHVVGHILFSQIDLVDESGSHPVLGLAPLAVYPNFQRQGVGSALGQEGLELTKSRPEPLVLVLGEPEYYSRFGFEPSVKFGIPSPFEVPAQYFMALGIDSATLQGRIVYSAAFDGV